MILLTKNMFCDFKEFFQLMRNLNVIKLLQKWSQTELELCTYYIRVVTKRFLFCLINLQEPKSDKNSTVNGACTPLLSLNARIISASN